MMVPRWLQGFLILFLLTNPVLLIAENVIRVDEGKTRLAITDNSALLKLAVAGNFTHDVPIHIELEFLDPNGSLIEAVSHDTILTRRSKHIDIPLTGQKNQLNSPWIRVRYRVTVTESGTEPAAGARGVLSISEIGPQPFMLRVGTPSHAIEGTRTRIHVFTQHPTSGRPVANVSIEGTLTVSDDAGEHVLTSAGRSNSSGYAALDFEVPHGLQDPEATIEVKARLGTFQKEISEDIDFSDRAEILLSTDKPLYQPGQNLRIRVLAFNALRRALAGVPLDLTIRDEEQSTVFRAELMTSQFGEAHSEWSVPENIRLGDYVVQVERGDGFSASSQQVKIGRYDLPNFTVTSKSDRTYYLPNQNAEVEIRAEYLFGQPVKQAHVRVVRETRRHWNYRDQKWETDEANIIQGDIDAQGRFLAKLDLQEEHDRLAGLDYQRYADLQYAAYVTDPTT